MKGYVKELELSDKSVAVTNQLIEKFGYTRLPSQRIEGEEDYIVLGIGLALDEITLVKLRYLIAEGTVCFILSQKPEEKTGFTEAEGSSVLLVDGSLENTVIAENIHTAVREEYHLEPGIGLNKS